MTKRYLELRIDPDKGFTLKLLCDICTHAEAHYKELEGIRPLQRVEAGFGIPKKPGDEETYYKAILTSGNPRWRLFKDAPQHCHWNLWIPDNWKDDLPKHRLYDSSIGDKRPTQVRLMGATPESYHTFMDAVEMHSNSFAYCESRISVRKADGCQRLFIDCGWLDSKSKFRAFRNVLCDMDILASEWDWGGRQNRVQCIQK